MNKLDNYARLIVEIGANVKKGEPVLINCKVKDYEFARLLAKHAYNAGASEVEFNWSDDELTKLKYLNVETEILEDIPQWYYDRLEYYYKLGANIINILSSDPELLRDIDVSKLTRASNALNKKIKPLRHYITNDEVSWVIAALPCEAWAKKVFPNSSKPVDDLYEAIFDVTRMNEDEPIKAWNDHLNYLDEKAKILNDYQFEKIVYTSSNGTNLEVEMPKNHKWIAGRSLNSKGNQFVANIPTEEIFSAPKRDGVNGILYASKPLSYSGKIVDDFYFEFKDGKVINYDARVGKEILDSMFSQDENSKYLGEIALVPYDSPISNKNILFYNTLFDENASCHFAFGDAYPVCIEGGDKLKENELLKKGINSSLIHVDFMVGTKDLSIIGITKDNKKVDIFKDGNYSI